MLIFNMEGRCLKYECEQKATQRKFKEEFSKESRGGINWENSEEILTDWSQTKKLEEIASVYY